MLVLLNTLITIFFNKENTHSLDHSQKMLLEQEIYKLFMIKCSIRYLNPIDMKHLIHQFPGANTCLSNLSELSCINYNDNEKSLFYGLAQICRSIEKIYIGHWSCDNLGLAKLIEMQKQIKYINIHQIYDEGKLAPQENHLLQYFILD